MQKTIHSYFLAGLILIACIASINLSAQARSAHFGAMSFGGGHFGGNHFGGNNFGSHNFGGNCARGFEHFGGNNFARGMERHNFFRRENLFDRGFANRFPERRFDRFAQMNNQINTAGRQGWMNNIYSHYGNRLGFARGGYNNWNNADENTVNTGYAPPPEYGYNNGWQQNMPYENWQNLSNNAAGIINP